MKYIKPLLAVIVLSLIALIPVSLISIIVIGSDYTPTFMYFIYYLISFVISIGAFAFLVKVGESTSSKIANLILIILGIPALIVVGILFIVLHS